MNLSRSFTRRSFLKTAAIAGAAPLILRSGLWGQGSAPSKQITLGFIGLGMQGMGLLENCLSRGDVRVLGVSDVDTTRRNAAQKKVETEYAKVVKGGTYNGCAAHADFRDLLARKEIDAVVIATPDHWHALTAIAAANAGKDIYCEKPLAHTVREGRAMVKAVRKHKRILQVGSMQRSMAEFRAACELVRNGVIGKVMKIDVAVGGPPVFCDLPAEELEPGLNWDIWLGPAPLRPYNSILSPRGECHNFPNWRHYREYAGGGVCDFGAHQFDIVQWAFGFDETGPVEFFPAEKPEAQSGVRWRYATGQEVTHQAHIGQDNGIAFYGDQGKIYVDRGRFQLWLGDQLKAETMDDYSRLLKELLPANAVRLYCSTNHMSDWVKSMASRQPPVCDVETGHRTATVCSLVNGVYFSGKGCEWDPRREQFVGGSGDEKWLTRDYRAPWKLA